MNTSKLGPVWFLLVLARVGFGQDQLTQKLDSLMNSYVEQRFFSGAVLLAKGDNILYQKGVGLADREKNVPVQPTTTFSIASVGKIFTATLMMQLVNEGKVDLQKTVHSYLPEWNVPNGDRIRVHHLLTHTGYTGNYMVHPSYDQIRSGARSIDDIMPLVVARVSVRDTVGREFRYSNSGYILLGKIAEKVTGQSYETLLQERIFNPAGMTNTHMQPRGFVAPAEATPYELFTNTSFISVKAGNDPAFPDGGAMTNVSDLWRFSRWFLKTVPAQTRQTMWTPFVQPKKNSYYGYGFVITEEHGRKQVSHDGGIGGWSADFRMVPDDEYVAIVLINQHLNPKEVTRKMLDIAYTGKTVMPTREFVRSVIDEIDRKGFSDVRGRFREILNAGYHYKPGPGDYIDLFNGLNELKRHEQALELARIAETAFPNQAWVYECIGDAYYGLKKQDEAKVAFEQALKVDPDNFWAKMMLQKMGK
ncbi:serine hydrolase [Fibrisoma montanum]|nr:serine hydrolase [Fibrisoma montanum]